MPSRRQVIRFTARYATALAGISLVSPAFATYQLTPYIAGRRRAEPDKTLSIYNLHTAETLTATFYRDGYYDEEVLTKINHLLRDWRTGDRMAMDTELLDILFDLQTRFESREPLHIISGYRSPKTNAMLAARSEGVDKNSFHMQGRAIDIRMPGVQTAAIRDAALELRRGGVGFYAPSDFLHLDTGPVRQW